MAASGIGAAPGDRASGGRARGWSRASRDDLDRVHQRRESRQSAAVRPSAACHARPRAPRLAAAPAELDLCAEDLAQLGQRSAERGVGLEAARVREGADGETASRTAAAAAAAPGPGEGGPSMRVLSRRAAVKRPALLANGRRRGGADPSAASASATTLAVARLDVAMQVADQVADPRRFGEVPRPDDEDVLGRRRHDVGAAAVPGGSPARAQDRAGRQLQGEDWTPSGASTRRRTRRRSWAVIGSRWTITDSPRGGRSRLVILDIAPPQNKK